MKNRRESRFLRGLVVLAAVLALLPSAASAEERAGAGSFSTQGGVYVFDHQQDLEKDAVGTIGVGYNFTDRLAAEIVGGVGHFEHKYFNEDECCCAEDNATGYMLRGEALYHFRPKAKLVPYLAAGAGGVWLRGENRSDEEYATVNYGAGVKYYLTDNIAFRGDARHIYGIEDSHNNFSTTVGLHFNFGGQPRAVTPAPAAVAPARPKPILVAEEKTPGEVTVRPVEIGEFGGRPPENGEKLSIDMKLQFGLDSAGIRPEDRPKLDKLGRFMAQYPETHAVVEGHTCNLGSASYNFDLSWRRARSVKDYLVKNFDIDPERLQARGYGLTRPIADNATEAGRKKNRRVLVVVSNGGALEVPEGLSHAPREKAGEPAARAAKAGERVLRRIDIDDEKEALAVNLVADGPVENFKVFALEGPNRLVVDLVGDWRGPERKEIPVDRKGVARVRMGRHPEHYRVVIDFSDAVAARPRVAPSEFGVRIQLPEAAMISSAAP